MPLTIFIITTLLPMKIKSTLVLLLLCVIPLPAIAQVAIQNTSKDKTVYEISPGETTTKEFNLINTISDPIEVFVYTADGKKNATGSFTVLQRDEQQVNIGSWATVSQSSLKFTGKETKKITFTISIPANTPPGDYAGGIVIETIREKGIVKGTGATVSLRVVAPVYVKVKGTKVTKYEWTDFSHAGQNDGDFTLSFKNSGNTIIKVAGNIEISDFFNNKTNIIVSDIILLQNDSITNKILWKEKPFFGFYTAKANLKFSELDLSQNAFVPINENTRTVNFNVIPVVYLIILCILICLIIVGIIINMRNYKKYLGKCSKYKTQQGDTLNTVAQKNKIEWSKLARINKLKAPYEIKEGTFLLIPPVKK
jgi:hypothetical protein